MFINKLDRRILRFLMYEPFRSDEHYFFDCFSKHKNFDKEVTKLVRIRFIDFIHEPEMNYYDINDKGINYLLTYLPTRYTLIISFLSFILSVISIVVAIWLG